MEQRLNASGFFSRNSNWLIALAFTFAWVSVDFMGASIKATNPQFASLPPRPDWVIVGAAILGLATSGAFAMLTNTLSAKIYRWTLVALGIAASLSVLFTYYLKPFLQSLM